MRETLLARWRSVPRPIRKSVVLTIGFTLIAIGGVLIILPLLSQEQIARRQSSRPSLKLLALISLLFAGGMVTQQASFASTTVTNGSFLITTTNQC